MRKEIIYIAVLTAISLVAGLINNSLQEKHLDIFGSPEVLAKPPELEAQP